MKLIVILGLLCSAAIAAAIPPADLVPMRWPLGDARSLELLANTPVNCLLVDWPSAAFPSIASAGAAKNLTVMAVIKPGAGDPADEARKAVAAQASGIVLEGDFPQSTGARVRDVLAGKKVLVVEITSRARMNFGSGDPIVGTNQGVWPGIQVQENGAAKAAPSGAAWIDTNTGFLQSARALAGSSTFWLANRPPEKTVLNTERYLQAVGDAAISGTRWVIAFDSGTAAALEKRDDRAVKTLQRVAGLIAWFESHRDWQVLPAGGRLAIVQDERHGALMSGGILDMISTKHTPVRPVPPGKLSPATLEGATMAVNVEPEGLTKGQQDVLLAWRRAGGTLLTAPPGWSDALPADPTVALDDKQLKRIDDMWHDVSNMIGRRNLGVRLFNVSSMLSTFRAPASGSPAVVELMNYADYPIENVTVHLLGKYTKARLFTPDGKEKPLSVYEVEEGTGIDIESVGTCAALRVE